MIISPRVILKLLRQLGKIVAVVGPLVVDLKGNLKDKTDRKDLHKAIELQATIIEKLDDQLRIIQTVLDKVQKSLLSLYYVAYTAAGLAILALVFSILK